MADTIQTKELEHIVMQFEEALIRFNLTQKCSALPQHHDSDNEQHPACSSKSGLLCIKPMLNQLSLLKRYLSTYSKTLCESDDAQSSPANFRRTSSPSASIRLPYHHTYRPASTIGAPCDPPTMNLYSDQSNLSVAIASNRIMHQPASKLRTSHPHNTPSIASKSVTHNLSTEIAGCGQTLAGFIATIEATLDVSDVDAPGSRTGAPPSPYLSSIRRSREACLNVWSQFFTSREKTPAKEIRDLLKEPTFDNWPWSDPDLITFVRFFFTGEGESDDRLHLCRHLSLSPQVLDTWLCAVYSHYNLVPFHNFKHAFMVTQMMYAAIRQADLASLFSHLDLFVLLFSALCHDLDHPGLTNFYQNNAQSRLSICYNTNSPLENHHCAVALDLIRTPHTNVFMGLNDADANLAKQLSLRCILGTDMAKHNDILDAFREKLSEHSIDYEINAKAVLITPLSTENGDSRVSSVSGLSAAESQAVSRQQPTTPSFADLASIFEIDGEARAMTLVILLKMCDISTEIRPTPVSEPWLACLVNELTAQFHLEQQTGLPISPIMDSSNLSKCQCSFLSFAMIPLAESLVSIIPGLRASFLAPAQRQLVYYTSLCLEEEEDEEEEKERRSQDMHECAQEEKNNDADSVTTDGEMEVSLYSDEAAAAASRGIEIPYSRPSHSFANIPQSSSPTGNLCTHRSFGEECTSCTVGSTFFHADSSNKQSCVAISRHLHAPSLSVQFSTSSPDRSPGCAGVGCDTTVVSSAGVAEFHTGTQALLRPLRRSLGELPWARSLHQEYADSENWYIDPPPGLRQSLHLPSPMELEEEEDNESERLDKDAAMAQYVFRRQFIRRSVRNSCPVRSLTPPSSFKKAPTVRKTSATAAPTL